MPRSKASIEYYEFAKRLQEKIADFGCSEDEIEQKKSQIYESCWFILL